MLVQIPKEKTALLRPETPHGAQHMWEVDDAQLCPGRSSRHGQSCTLTRSPRLGWPCLLSCGRSAPGSREGRGGAWRTVYAHPALIGSAKCVTLLFKNVFIIVRELPRNRSDSIIRLYYLPY